MGEIKHAPIDESIISLQMENEMSDGFKIKKGKGKPTNDIYTEVAGKLTKTDEFGTRLSKQEKKIKKNLPPKP